MNLYLCETLLEAPLTEYGGLMAITAENADQAVQVLIDFHQENYKEIIQHQENYELVGGPSEAKAIIKEAKVFPLAPDFECEAGVQYFFIT